MGPFGVSKVMPSMVLISFSVSVPPAFSMAVSAAEAAAPAAQPPTDEWRPRLWEVARKVCPEMTKAEFEEAELLERWHQVKDQLFR